MRKPGYGLVSNHLATNSVVMAEMKLGFLLPSLVIKTSVLLICFHRAILDKGVLNGLKMGSVRDLTILYKT